MNGSNDQYTIVANIAIKLGSNYLRALTGTCIEEGQTYMYILGTVLKKILESIVTKTPVSFFKKYFDKVITENKLYRSSYVEVEILKSFVAMHHGKKVLST